MTKAIVVLAFLSIVFLVRATTAQDPVKLAPQLYHVVLDNDRVRVIDYHLKPGEKEPMHSHPSGVLVYYFTDATMRVSLPDGKVAESANRSGDVVWRDPVTHFAENIGTTEVHALLVEPKDSCKTPDAAARPLHRLGSTTSTGGMPAHLEPHHHVRYENQYLRVLEVTLKPGEGSLFHTHELDAVYVPLADAVARLQRQGEAWGPKTAFRTGEASFDNASTYPFTHRLKNVGTTTFHTLSVELCPQTFGTASAEDASKAIP